MHCALDEGPINLSLCYRYTEHQLESVNCTIQQRGRDEPSNSAVARVV